MEGICSRSHSKGISIPTPPQDSTNHTGYRLLYWQWGHSKRRVGGYVCKINPKALKQKYDVWPCIFRVNRFNYWDKIMDFSTVFLSAQKRNEEVLLQAWRGFKWWLRQCRLEVACLWASCQVLWWRLAYPLRG